MVVLYWTIFFCLFFLRLKFIIVGSQMSFNFAIPRRFVKYFTKNLSSLFHIFQVVFRFEFYFAVGSIFIDLWIIIFSSLRVVNSWLNNFHNFSAAVNYEKDTPCCPQWVHLYQLSINLYVFYVLFIILFDYCWDKARSVGSVLIGGGHAYTSLYLSGFMLLLYILLKRYRSRIFNLCDILSYDYFSGKIIILLYVSICERRPLFPHIY